MFQIHIIDIFCLITIYVLSKSVEARDCNEYACGSVVSKCLLTQSCQCKYNDCYCCEDCIHCMGSLFIECCSCLDMCPPPKNDTEHTGAPHSSIGDFEGLPELFDTLTAEDYADEWSTERFSNYVGLHQQFGSSLNRRLPASSVNCTVIFLNSCLSSKKCLQYCESMGSNSYRWFDNGCCECVGPRCFNYGINESRCLACPSEDNAIDEAEMDYGDSEENLDYGEDEINYN